MEVKGPGDSLQKNQRRWLRYFVRHRVPAEAGESTIRVADASQFRVDSGRYRQHNDDIALFGMNGDAHDWYHCEYVKLLSVDREAGTITVRRGCYGTPPLAFRAGESRAAALQVRIGAGVLASATEAEVLNGANAAAMAPYS